MKNHIYILFIVLCFPLIVNGQWGNSPETALSVPDDDKESVVLNVKSDQQGNYLAAWYDNEFRLLFQSFNTKGYKKFDEGFLISDESQLSFIGEFSMIVDQADNLILAHSDIRDTDSPNIILYKLSQEPAFLWPEAGVRLSMDENYNIGPQVKEDSDGNIICAWNILEDPDVDKSYIALNMITESGDIVFEEARKLVEVDADLLFPSIHINDDGSFFLVYSASISPGSNGHIHMMKYSKDLMPLFEEPLQITKYPGALNINTQEVKVDPLGNIWIAWFDDNDGAFKFEAKIQKVDSQGIIMFPEGGMLIANIPDSMSLYPKIIDFVNGGPLLYYVIADNNQGQFGFNMQKLDENANRLWGEKGRVVVAPNPYISASFNAVKGPEKSLLFYSEFENATLSTKAVKVLGVDYEASLLWTQTPIVLIDGVTRVTDKSLIAPENEEWLIGWVDNRFGRDVSFLQNLTLDGKLGNPSSIQEYKPKQAQAYQMFSDRIRFDESPTMIQIYDQMGRIVDVYTEMEQTLDMSHFRNGLYLIRTADQNGQELRIKFLKK